MSRPGDVRSEAELAAADAASGRFQRYGNPFTSNTQSTPSGAVNAPQGLGGVPAYKAGDVRTPEQLAAAPVNPTPLSPQAGSGYYAGVNAAALQSGAVGTAYKNMGGGLPPPSASSGVVPEGYQAPFARGDETNKPQTQTTASVFVPAAASYQGSGASLQAYKEYNKPSILSSEGQYSYAYNPNANSMPERIFSRFAIGSKEIGEVLGEQALNVKTFLYDAPKELILGSPAEKALAEQGIYINNPRERFGLINPETREKALIGAGEIAALPVILSFPEAAGFGFKTGLTLSAIKGATSEDPIGELAQLGGQIATIEAPFKIVGLYEKSAALLTTRNEKAADLINPQFIYGAERYPKQPTTQAGQVQLIEDINKQGYVYSASPERLSQGANQVKILTQEEKTAAGLPLSETGGLYADYRVSPMFTSQVERNVLSRGYSLPSFGNLGSIQRVKVEGAMRLPEEARISLETGNVYLDTKAASEFPSKVFISPAREFGKTESEVIIPANTVLIRNPQKNFIEQVSKTDFDSYVLIPRRFPEKNIQNEVKVLGPNGGEPITLQGTFYGQPVNRLIPVSIREYEAAGASDQANILLSEGKGFIRASELENKPPVPSSSGFLKGLASVPSGGVSEGLKPSYQGSGVPSSGVYAPSVNYPSYVPSSRGGSSGGYSSPYYAPSYVPSGGGSSTPSSVPSYVPPSSPPSYSPSSGGSGVPSYSPPSYRSSLPPSNVPPSYPNFYREYLSPYREVKKGFRKEKPKDYFVLPRSSPENIVLSLGFGRSASSPSREKLKEFKLSRAAGSSDFPTYEERSKIGKFKIKSFLKKGVL